MSTNQTIKYTKSRDYQLKLDIQDKKLVKIDSPLSIMKTINNKLNPSVLSLKKQLVPKPSSFFNIPLTSSSFFNIPLTSSSDYPPYISSIKTHLHRLHLVSPSQQADYSTVSYFYHSLVSKLIHPNFSLRHPLILDYDTIKAKLPELVAYRHHYVFYLSSGTKVIVGWYPIKTDKNKKYRNNISYVKFVLNLPDNQESAKQNLLELNRVFPLLTISYLEYAMDIYGNTDKIQTLFRQHCTYPWQHQTIATKGYQASGGRTRDGAPKQGTIISYLRTEEGALYDTEGNFKQRDSTGSLIKEADYFRLELQIESERLKKIFDTRNKLSEDATTKRVPLPWLIEDAHFEIAFSKAFKLSVLDGYNIRNKTIQRTYDLIQLKNKSTFLKNTEELDLIESSIRAKIKEASNNWKIKDSKVCKTDITDYYEEYTIEEEGTIEINSIEEKTTKYGQIWLEEDTNDSSLFEQLRIGEVHYEKRE